MVVVQTDTQEVYQTVNKWSQAQALVFHDESTFTENFDPYAKDITPSEDLKNTLRKVLTSTGVQTDAQEVYQTVNKWSQAQDRLQKDKKEAKGAETLGSQENDNTEQIPLMHSKYGMYHDTRSPHYSKFSDITEQIPLMLSRYGMHHDILSPHCSEFSDPEEMKETVL